MTRCLIAGKRSLTVVSLLALTAGVGRANTITVCWDGSGDYVTIQAAINGALDGDVIVVCEGHYEENISFLGKDITLTSIDPEDPDVIANTIIDGAVNGPVVTFTGDEGDDCLLTGFTITNGFNFGDGGGIAGNHTHCNIARCKVMLNTSQGRGGGIADVDGAISYCVIRGNAADAGGGGLYGCNGAILACEIGCNYSDNGYAGGLLECHGVIADCTINSNSALNGGGLFNCDGNISACIVVGGHVNLQGGGLKACHGTIEDSVIANAEANRGGGIANCDGVIKECTICANRGRLSGGGLYGCDGEVKRCAIVENTSKGGGGLDNCSATLLNCLFLCNLAYPYNGGGLRRQSGEVLGCVIAGNRANTYGGGVANLTTTLCNCTLVGNLAGEKGGAFYSDQSDVNVDVFNTILCNNDALFGPQVYLEDLEAGASFFTIDYSLCAGGEADVYVGDGWTLQWGSHNHIDPCDELFIDPGEWLGGGQFRPGDYHLLPTAPVIDAGHNSACPLLTEDIDGDNRVIDGDGDETPIVDIGADEYQWVLARPTPDWMRFEDVHVAFIDGDIHVFLTAAPASVPGDPNPTVEYLFESPAGACRAPASGWQNSNEHVVTDVVERTWYSFRVKARNADQPPAETSSSPMYIVSTWPGDLNQDGAVDQADLGNLLAAWMTSEDGDIDGDGDTDQSDLGILLAHWGEGCP
jgi:hypothetical protein